jgi:putative flippase GtrA
MRLPAWIERLRADRTMRFLVVGGYNAAFGYVVFVALYYWIGGTVHYNIVLLISYLVSTTNSYLLQRRFVFASRSRRLPEFVRFNLVNLAGMLVNMGFLSLAVNFVTPKIALAQAAALVFTIAFLYAGHSLFSFGTHRGREP